MKIINFLQLIGVILAVVLNANGRTHGVNQGIRIKLLRLKRDHQGITGPVHTFVKTDKHANFKWGVRHHVGHHYSG